MLTSVYVENRSVEDVRLASKVLLGKLHSKVPIPYRDEIATNMKGKKLKFGYYLSGTCGCSVDLCPVSHAHAIGADGFVKASPACQRAVKETIAGVQIL